MLFPCPHHLQLARQLTLPFTSHNNQENCSVPCTRATLWRWPYWLGHQWASLRTWAWEVWRQPSFAIWWCVCVGGTDLSSWSVAVGRAGPDVLRIGELSLQVTSSTLGKVGPILCLGKIVKLSLMVQEWERRPWVCKRRRTSPSPCLLLQGCTAVLTLVRRTGESWWAEWPCNYLKLHSNFHSICDLYSST